MVPYQRNQWGVGQGLDDSESEYPDLQVAQALRLASFPGDQKWETGLPFGRVSLYKGNVLLVLAVRAVVVDCSM